MIYFLAFRLFGPDNVREYRKSDVRGSCECSLFASPEREFFVPFISSQSTQHASFQFVLKIACPVALNMKGRTIHTNFTQTQSFAQSFILNLPPHISPHIQNAKGVSELFLFVQKVHSLMFYRICFFNPASLAKCVNPF